MMKKVCFIVPYFGTFPNTFEYWLQCCRNNKEFNWIIFTDDKTKYDYPENVRVMYSTLNNIKKVIEAKIGFDISLVRPYKLCDVRPLYGYIFSDYLNQFDYWGYCDLDILFGDLKVFLNDEIFEKYQKISFLGHMSLLKNCEEINQCFMKCDYRAILKNPRNRVFDEIRFSPNINELLKNSGYNILKLDNIADIAEEPYNFELYGIGSGNRCVKIANIPTVFRYKNNKLFKLTIEGKKIDVKEIMYVHFQKRNINVGNLKSDFLLVPNEIIDDYDVTIEDIMRFSKRKLSYFIKHRCKRIRNVIKSRLIH